MAPDDFDAVARLFHVDGPTDEESSRMYGALVGHIANSEAATRVRAAMPHEAPDALASRRMRRALDAHMQVPIGRRRRRAGIVAVVSVAAVVALWISASVMGRPDTAEALLSIAEATKRLPADEFAGTAVERRIDQLVLQI